MDIGGNPYGGFMILFFILLLSSILQLFEEGMKWINDSDFSYYEEENASKVQKIKALKESQELLSATIQVMTVFFSVLAGAFCMALTLLSVKIRILSAVVFWAALVLIGILTGRYIGKRYALQCIWLFYTPVVWSLALFRPITYVLQHLIEVLFAWLPREASEAEVTEEQIISKVNEAHEQGDLDASEAEMIQNIFRFDDLDAQDIMTNRANIVGINCNQNLEQMIGFIVEQKNSRFPVYEENIDKILGIIHLKDALCFHNMGTYENWLIRDIPGLIRPAVFIPQTRSINDLFRSMQAKKLQMVIVLDEYGQTSGLVAMEDILEEIVGNIQDEYDEDPSVIEKIGKNSYLVEGMTRLEELEKLLDISLEESEVETLNGYLVHCLDRIPDQTDLGMTIEKYGYQFKILEISDNVIQKAEIGRLPEIEKSDEKSEEEQ